MNLQSLLALGQCTIAPTHTVRTIGAEILRTDTQSTNAQARHRVPIPQILSSRRGPRMLRSEYRGVKTARCSMDEAAEDLLEVEDRMIGQSASILQSQNQTLLRQHQQSQIPLRQNLWRPRRPSDHRAPLHTTLLRRNPHQILLRQNQWPILLLQHSRHHLDHSAQPKIQSIAR